MKTRMFGIVLAAFLLALTTATAQAPNPNHLSVTWSYMGGQSFVSVVATYDQNSLDLVEFILWFSLADGTVERSVQYVPANGQSAPPGVRSQCAGGYPLAPGSTVVWVQAFGVKFTGDIAQSQ
jgi:hypothetical protein